MDGQEDKPKPDKNTKVIEIYKNGLDDLVNVNSLFTIAVFVGLSYATPGQRSLENRPECDAEPRQAKLLVVLEVVAFSCFLLSSLVAKSLKVNLQIYGDQTLELNKKGEPVGLKFGKWCFLCLSVNASFLGCFFLMLSMYYLIQIRLGKLSCKSPYTEGATLSMIIIVSIGMLIYIPIVLIAIRETFRRKGKGKGKGKANGNDERTTSGKEVSATAEEEGG